MYGIPNYNSNRQKRTGMSLKDWCICIGCSALVLVAVVTIMMGVQAMFIDTMRQSFPR